ncbi:MAG: agmatinase [Sulfolobales archaeon]
MSNEVELFLIRSPYAFGGYSGRRDKTPFSILGIPLDMTSSFRSGYRMAPLSIRVAAQNLEYFSMRFGVDVEDFLYVDEGDVILPQDGVLKALDIIKMVSEYLLANGRIPVFLGGEHTLTIATVRAAAEVFSRDICVLVFDAHADLRIEYSGTKYSHACVVSRLLDFISKDHIYLVGTRAISGVEHERLKSSGLRFLTSKSLKRAGIKHSAGLLQDFISSCGKVYLSLDMDVFDPAYAPGVATPEPDGLTPSDILDLLYEIVNNKFVAMDVVEVTPPYDPSMITSMLAARVIIEFMAGVYQRVKTY